MYTSKNTMKCCVFLQDDDSVGLGTTNRVYKKYKKLTDTLMTSISKLRLSDVNRSKLQKRSIKKCTDKMLNILELIKVTILYVYEFFISFAILTRPCVFMHVCFCFNVDWRYRCHWINSVDVTFP